MCTAKFEILLILRWCFITKISFHSTHDNLPYPNNIALMNETECDLGETCTEVAAAAAAAALSVN